MALAPIIMPILSVFKSGGVKEASSAVQGLGSKFGGLVKTATKAAGALAGFQAIASSKEFVNTSIDATQKFERNLLALTQTFETATPALRSFIKEVENYGLSQQQAAQASVFLGSVLKQYGFSTKDAGDQTERLVTLAQDLATTYGYDVQDSLLAITALFRGEYDPIEKFGVAMKQNEINAYLAAKGLGDLTGAELANAQATARLELLFERAADSVGAFTRASDTLYGSQQRLNAIMGNLQVAFGSAFQKPLADVNNALANVAKDGGGQLVDISRVLGETIGYLVPTIEDLGTLVINLIAPLEQIIGFFGVLASGILKVLNPAIDAANIGLDMFNNLLDGATNEILAFNEAINEDAGRKKFEDFLNGFFFNDRDWSFENTVIGGYIAAIEKFNNDKANQNILDKALQRPGIQLTEMQKDARLIERYAEALELAASKAADLESSRVTDILRGIGIAADEATGKTSSLSSVFAELDNEIAQSNARESLEGLGLSAGLIEKVLTSPNWEQIFGDISRLAYLTSLDLSNMFITDVIAANLEKAGIRERLTGAFTVDGKEVKSANKQKVATIFDDLQKSVKEQTARIKLQGMTGSEGLVEMILGREDGLTIAAQIKKGTISLKDLERQFYKTAAGAQELADIQAKATQELEDATQKILDQEEAYAELVKSLEMFRASMKDLVATDVLRTIEIQMGRFESAVVSKLENIKSSLKNALDNGQIFQGAYNQLVAYANKEFSALQAIQRQRDALADKYDFVSNLLKGYRDAFTASLNLTSLIGQLESKTRQVTVTEVRNEIVSVGNALKDLQVTIKREYTETITETVSKSEALVNSFRDMAEKAKSFAQNLQKLKQMGLDPQLFNQLVQAGVEAGGETAQALIDGGQETVTEISQLFKEIGDTGVAVGESVAEQFYNTGEDFASSLLDGIRSQQSAFEEAARQMADAFQQNFDVKIGNAIQQVSDTSNLNNQLSAFEIEQQRIANRIAEQEAILTGGTAGPGAREWAEKKLASYLDQLNNVEGQISGTQNALDQIQIAPLATGGIALGAALSLIGEGGPEAVIPLDRLDSMLSGRGMGGDVYNINVQASGKAEGAMAGQEIVKALKQFQAKNGSFNNSLVGFGS